MVFGGIMTGLFYLPSVFDSKAIIEINGEPTTNIFAKVSVVFVCWLGAYFALKWFCKIGSIKANT